MSVTSHYDVFLSHNSADKAPVEELARRLVQAGIQPFLDKWHLIPGEPWQEAIGEALRTKNFDRRAERVPNRRGMSQIGG